MRKDPEYFLCSSEFIEIVNPLVKSKPFKSGFEFEKDGLYYVAIFDFEAVTEKFKEDFKKHEFAWCRQCVDGQMNVDKITIASIKRNGLFMEIQNILNLTAARNQAMTIYNLSLKYHCNPVTFINKSAAQFK